MANYSGGCLCGAIRYEVNGEPVRAANCHCVDCRRVTGSQFATNVFFNVDDLAVIEGEPKAYRHTADSGNTMTKWFCADCGSQLFSQSTGNTAVKGVKLGSLDDVKEIRPGIDIFLDSAVPFADPPDYTSHFGRGPN